MKVRSGVRHGRTNAAPSGYKLPLTRCVCNVWAAAAHRTCRVVVRAGVTVRNARCLPFMACLGAGVLFIGVQLLWYLLLRLHVSRSRVRVARVHGNVVIHATARPLRRPEDRSRARI